MSKLLIRTLIFSLFCFLSLPSFGQELNGWVIDQKYNVKIANVHVINKTTLKGTISDSSGYFSIKLKFGDTLVFSNVSYQYFYFIYSDSSAVLKNVVVDMLEQNYLLHEVSIFSYALSTNKEREMKFQQPLYPTTEELSDGRIVEAGLDNPAEYLYNLFGSKPRQLRKLAQLKEEESYRKKLEESNNRESVITLTGLSKEELEAFMFYCKYAPVRMHDMNDYVFLKSVQRCYAEYIKDKELEGFLQQFD